MNVTQTAAGRTRGPAVGWRLRFATAGGPMRVVLVLYQTRTLEASARLGSFKKSCIHDVQRCSYAMPWRRMIHGSQLPVRRPR
jgi:hypothetical protein